MDRRRLSIKNTLKNSFGMIYETWIYILLFELIYKALILLLFKPFLNIIVSLFIRAGGYDVLVNEDISQILLSFTGILMVIVLITLSVILIYYEFVVILLILDRGKNKEKIRLLDITEGALLKLRNVIKNKNTGLALYILFLIPILNIGIQSSLLPTLSIPDFITGEVSKYPGGEIVFFILTLALIYLFAKLFIVLPVMLFSDKSFKEARRISFRTIKGQGFKIAFLIIMGMAIWLALTYLPFMILENTQFILLRILRVISNFSMMVFTLLISPFILSISLESYNSYTSLGLIKREEVDEKIELGYIGRKLWKLLEKTFELIQVLIVKIKSHAKIFILLLLVILIVLNLYIERNLGPIVDKPLVIGHRGGYYGIENTIDTILFVGDNGADYVEMDILLTKDNIPVVIHDNNLKRLANISKNISDLTLEEVKAITIRSGDEEDKIPSLEELAREVKGRTKLLVEFKRHGKEKASIVDKAVEILDKEGILEETIFHTSEYELIEEFNEKYEDLPIGYVFIGKIGTFSAKKMSNLPVDFISAEDSLINKKMIREAHRAGKPVFAWTINDDYKVEILLELGVDGIITDYPIETLPIIDKYKEYNLK